MNLQELKGQLESQNIKADEAAIASKLEAIGITPEEITDEIQEVVIQDLAQAFRDEQNGSAIAPRKRSQKQAIADIRNEFARHGIQYTDVQIKNALQSKNMDAVDVELSQVQDWANEINGSYLAKAEQAIAPQPPSQSNETPPEVIDIPWSAQQAIASGADSMRSNVGSYIAQQEAELSETQSLLVQYNRALEVRLWTGVGQQLQSQGGPAFDIAKANREGWDKLKSSLKTAIANVNDFAGIKTDAA